MPYKQSLFYPNLHGRDHYKLIYTDEETEAQRFKYHAQGHVPKRRVLHPNALSTELKGQQTRLSEELVSYWLNQFPHHMPSANFPKGWNDVSLSRGHPRAPTDLSVIILTLYFKQNQRQFWCLSINICLLTYFIGERNTQKDVQKECPEKSLPPAP